MSRRFIILVVLGLLLVFPRPGQVLAGDGKPDSDLIRQRALALERLFLKEGPSVNLSVVYRQVPPQQRAALLGKLKEMLLAHLPADILEASALDGYPPEVRPFLAQALVFLKAVKPEELDAVVQKMDLDHLAPLPAAAFQVYHGRALSEPGPGGGTRLARLEADRNDPVAWRELVARTPGYIHEGDGAMDLLEILSPDADVPADELPADTVEPASISPLVEATFMARLPGHVLVNSRRLARALCHLTNPSSRARPMTVRIAGREHLVRSGVELVNAVLATGQFDVTVFDARMFVDFLHYSVPREGAPLPVKIPTWAATGVDPADPERRPVAGDGRRQLLIPMNHSEHILVFWTRGTTDPRMLVKWYMGLPMVGQLKQGTLFKAAIEQRTSWCGFRIVRTYDGPVAARGLVQAGSLLMQLYNFMQQRFAVRMNGYGLYAVCQDTTGLMEAILGLSSGRSTVWPLARDPRLDFYYEPILGPLGLRVTREDQGRVVLNVPSDARPDIYPWILERPSLLHRVGANVPTRDPASLHFPELQGAINALRERSEAFRRGLALFD